MDAGPRSGAGTPSDELPAVLARGTTDVRVAVLSLSARAADGSDADYLAWHLLDHLPEQHRLAGLRAGTRWVSTPACRAARAASTDRFDAVDHAVAYLMADPVEETLDTWFGLGADLRAGGRMARLLPSVELAGYELVERIAARRIGAGADVLPWRPNLGAYLLIERGDAATPASLVDVEGVAGLWCFDGSASLHERFADTAGLRLTLCYLDDDPVATADRLGAVLVARWAAADVEPLLAAPFAAIVPFAWDHALPGA